MPVNFRNISLIRNKCYNVKIITPCHLLLIVAQHTGTGAGNVPIGTGGVTHPAATNNPAAASGSHGISSSGIGHHGAPAANHSSSLLWTKTQQLPEDLFRQASVNAIIPQITKNIT